MATNLLAHWPLAFETSIRSFIIALDLPLPVAEATMWTWRIRPIVCTTILPFPKDCCLLAHVTTFDVLASLWAIIGFGLSFLRTDCGHFTTVLVMLVLRNRCLQQ